MKLVRIVLVLIGLALMGVSTWLFVGQPRTEVLTPPTELTEGSMRFEIADTPQTQRKGLGGRTPIPDDYGMLFVFPEKGRYGIWMKDMVEPIDIIWLNDDGSIILINHSVSPSTYPEIFYPPVPVTYVLETRAGYALDHGWEVGTKVALPAPYR